MIGSMNGKQGGVYVKYVSLIVSCYWIKGHHCMIVKDNTVKVNLHAEMCQFHEKGCLKC